MNSFFRRLFRLEQDERVVKMAEDDAASRKARKNKLARDIANVMGDAEAIDISIEVKARRVL